MLWIRTPANMTGYLNLPEKTREVLTPTAGTTPATCCGATPTAPTPSSAAPTTCSSAAARTSIPARSRAMLERHPDVMQACVVPVPDEIKGQKPFAFVVPRAGARVDRGRDQAVRPRQRARLPASALRRLHGASCRSPAPTRSTAMR